MQEVDETEAVCTSILKEREAFRIHLTFYSIVFVDAAK